MNNYIIALTRHTVQTIALYIVIYLYSTFVIWKFENPFQWIIDIPTCDDKDRAMILSYFIMYVGISLFVHYQIVKEKTKTP